VDGPIRRLGIDLVGKRSHSACDLGGGNELARLRKVQLRIMIQADFPSG
jgi:hypothetical protein